MTPDSPDESFAAQLSGFPVVSSGAQSAAREPLETLASEFAYRQRHGHNPTIEEYAEQHPRLAAQIRELFPLVLAMEQWKVDTEATSLRQGVPHKLSIERLGENRIIRELARGGMGVVFEAEHLPSGRRVAVKLLPWPSTAVPRWRERFQREAEMVGRLSHPNIVPILDFGEYGGFCYYVMPFVEGVGLDWVIQRLRESQGVVYADEIHKLRSLPSDGETPRREGESESSTTAALPDEHSSDSAQSSVSSGSAPPSQRNLRRGAWRGIVRIGLQVVEALRYSHQLRILHNDIKPANLLLDAQGRVWITDFGLAQPLEEESDNDRLAGTLRYMAPERFVGTVDERSDLYSLGITLYELSTLTAPWDEHDPARLLPLVLESAPKAPSAVVPEIPPDFERILLKAIAKQPSDRYQSAAALAEDLVRFLNRQPLEFAARTPRERVVDWGRRWLRLS